MSVKVEIREKNRLFFMYSSISKKLVHVRIFKTRYFAELCSKNMYKRLLSDQLFRVRLLNSK